MQGGLLRGGKMRGRAGAPREEEQDTIAQASHGGIHHHQEQQSANTSPTRHERHESLLLLLPPRTKRHRCRSRSREEHLLVDGAVGPAFPPVSNTFQVRR